MVHAVKSGMLVQRVVEEPKETLVLRVSWVQMVKKGIGGKLVILVLPVIRLLDSKGGRDWKDLKE